MCAKNECDSRHRTKTKKTNNYVHIHVFTQVCHVIVGFHVLRVNVSVDLGFHVFIGVGRLTVQQEGFIRQLHSTTHARFQVQNSSFWML